MFITTNLHLQSRKEGMHVQSCLTLCDPKDCSQLRSSVHGLFQARILEQVAVSFSTGSSQPREDVSLCLLCLLQWPTDSLPLHHLGSPDLDPIDITINTCMSQRHLKFKKSLTISVLDSLFQMLTTSKQNSKPCLSYTFTTLILSAPVSKQSTIAKDLLIKKSQVCFPLLLPHH